jgi:AraC-like DNA-binding protein
VSVVPRTLTAGLLRLREAPPLIQVTDPRSVVHAEPPWGGGRIISVDRVDFELFGAVTSSVIEDVLRRQRESVLHSATLAAFSGLREALCNLLVLNGPPFVSVNALSQSVTCSRRTLDRAWLAAFGQVSEGMTLKRTMMATTLLKALALRCDNSSADWSVTATQLGVSPRTLRSYVRLWAGTSPTEMDRPQLQALVERLESDLSSLMMAGGEAGLSRPTVNDQPRKRA